MATSCYEPIYLPASFKGVPFEATTASSEHGRRGAVGEFPFGETPAYADLGRKVRKYSIKARFVENNHVAQSAALVAAVESIGSGILVHPTRGPVNVACTSAKFEDDVLEGQGITTADLEFTEAVDWPGGMSLGGELFGLADLPLVSAALSLFDSVFHERSVSFFAKPTLVHSIGVIGEVVRNEYISATGGVTTSTRNAVVQEFSTILSDSGNFVNPSVVRELLYNGIRAVGSVTSGTNKFQAMRRIANSVGSASLGGRGGIVQNAAFTLARVTAGAQLANGAAEAQYSTSTAAFAAFDTVTALLKTEASIAFKMCQNNLFLELDRYLVKAQDTILSKALTAPAIVRYTLRGGLHPLVAAYQIYGDAKKLRSLTGSNALHGIKLWNEVTAVL